MNKDNQEFVNSLLQRLAKLNYIKPGDVPNIDLYMDQVTTFMDEHLSDVKRYEDDKILTKTMINNYTKNDLLPPPVKKKYSKEHIYVLTFIYYLKNILSISDIQKLLNPLTDKFFNKEELPDLEYIYSEIYNMEKAQIASLSKDVVERHVTANEVYEFIKEEYPTIGKGTVYRNLDILVEEGALRKVEVPNGPNRFDFTLKNHYHVRCIKCGEIFDVDMDQIPDLLERIHNTHGIEFVDYDISFKGICPKCREKVKEEQYG